jgi:hypothetical protein
MRDSLGVPRKQKLMQVDANRENLYNLCINNGLTLREMSETMQLSLYKIKAYVGELMKAGHLEKYEVGTTANNYPIIKFKSTENVYKARTIEELDECLAKRKETVSEPKKYLYDDITAPNIRRFYGKTSLLETKPTKDFLNGQKGKVNRSVSTSWGMYDTF